MQVNATSAHGAQAAQAAQAQHGVRRSSSDADGGADESTEKAAERAQESGTAVTLNTFA